MHYGAESVVATSLSVAQVVTERYPLAVPRYQRSYAWEDEAVGYFVQDVESLLDQSAGQIGHFFGGIVCVELSDYNKARPQSYEVVDGQQRLATFMLALSCVVEVADAIAIKSSKTNATAASRANVLRDSTLDEYVTYKDSDQSAGTTAVRCRMKLSLADDPMFQALMLRTPPPPSSRESHRLLVASRAALLNMVERRVGATGSVDGRIDRLIRVQQALLQDSHLIHIVSRERTQANRLFSVLNHRGESLSDADLLRSRSLELLENHPAQHEEAARVWDDMLGEPSKSIDAFFRALYPSRTGARIHGDLFESITTSFFPESAPTTAVAARDLVETVRGFRDELDTYLRLIRGEWPYARPTSKPTAVRAWQIDRLKRLVVSLQHELALPVLLAAATSVTEKTFADLVYMLEIFSFRYKIICGAHASRPANIYNSQSALIRAAAQSGRRYTLTSFRAQLQQLIVDHASDVLFKQQLIETLRYSNTSQRANVKEFLTTVEDHQGWWERTGSKQLNAKPKPTTTKIIDLEDSTLEHIYPQTALKGNVNTDLELVKHSIANLTFFGANDNSSAGNKPFTAKRSVYSASSIRMTSDLSKLTAWTLKEYADREESLLEQAVRIFVL